MLRDILRTFGFGCIIAGGILYFVGPTASISSTATDESRVQMLEQELKAVKKELAIAQRTSSVDSDGSTDKETDKKETVISSKEDKITRTVLTIEPGAVSTKISSRLERAGIINSAAEFDHYLESNGLSGRIQVGDYVVESSMDLKTIAAIITKSK
ncbi:hypothetical protein HNO89_002961 [Sporosarcina luteola]|nr:hypothetical protein [Sporosarcina luteola]